MKPFYQLNIAPQSSMSPLGEEVGFLEVSLTIAYIPDRICQCFGSSADKRAFIQLPSDRQPLESCSFALTNGQGGDGLARERARNPWRDPGCGIVRSSLLPCDVVSATTVFAARSTTPCLAGFLASRNAIPQSTLVVLARQKDMTKSTTLLLARCDMTQSKMKGAAVACSQSPE